MLLGKVKKQVETKENEIKLFLSNNYKESAYQSYKEYVDLLTELHTNGKINDKDFSKLITKSEDYKKLFSQFINQ